MLASLNGNLFVTPRVIFGLSRDGLGPGCCPGSTPAGRRGPALLLVAFVSVLLAATGTFERLLSLAITFILVTDGFMVVVLFRLRAAATRRAVPGAALPGASRSLSCRSMCCCSSGR